MTTTQAPPSSPAAPQRQSLPGRALAFVRNTWRGLTGMRTALALLFLLAVAAIPGALLPQRSLNEPKVAQYIADRPTLGPWMDRLELFDVFSSFWFTAIYVLLFVSLVGCILPRCLDHYRALRTDPVPTPRNLSRLPHHYSTTVDESPEEVVERIHGRLRGWRAVRRGEAEKAVHPGEVTLSAEKGYTRELGNLVFHLALVALLVSIAVGKLFGYEGSVIVIADDGPGFCSTSPAVFDSFRAGNVRDGTGMTPICVRVKDFQADYLDNGQAEMFTSNVAYQAGDDLTSNTWREATLQVNHPLRVAGDRVYLQGHGYAPTFTVTFPNGETRTETVQWRPDDATTFLSSGALRIDPPGGMYPDNDERRKQQIAIEGLFAPTAAFNGKLLTSVYPEMTDPAVAVDIYKGDTGLDTGKPQSLFSLDKSLIEQDRLVKQARVNLKPGEGETLPDGTKVTFDGAKEFVNLQVSHDPAQGWVLISAITMMAGLLVSLLIRRRRIWVRAYPADGEQSGEPGSGACGATHEPGSGACGATHEPGSGACGATHEPGSGATHSRRTVVELGGLARTDHAGWGDEFDRLRSRLLPGERENASSGE